MKLNVDICEDPDRVPTTIFFLKNYTVLLLLISRDENGSDTDGYHWYYICFHISGRIRIRVRTVSVIPDRIWLDVDIINIRFEYSDMDTVSDVEYPDSDTPVNGFGLEYGRKISVPFSSLLIRGPNRVSTLILTRNI
jgi:hypothetical protein